MAPLLLLQPRAMPQPRSAAQPAALLPLFPPQPPLLPPPARLASPPTLPLQEQQQHFPQLSYAPPPHSTPPSALPSLQQHTAQSDSFFSRGASWAPPAAHSYGAGGGAPVPPPPQVQQPMASPPSFLPFVPPPSNTLPPPPPALDVGASLSAPARRAPPPYRPPSGLVTDMAMQQMLEQADREQEASQAQPSVFDAVDALAQQTTRSSFADPFGGASGAPFAPPSLLPPAPARSSALPPSASASSASSASGSGLANAAGEYNCFLNSLVQALFHVRCFREYLLANTVPSAAQLHARSGMDVSVSVALVAALQELFSALRAGVMLRRDASGGAPGIAAPTALRHALAALSPSGEGGLHAMADASEVLCHMYDAFAAVSAAARATQCAADDTPVARMFGMAVAEHVACASRRCGKRTHELTYTQFFHIAHAAALRDAKGAADAATASLGDPVASTELLLSRLMVADAKPCDKDAGGCGAPAPTRHALHRAPRVFTLSLAWDTATAAEEEVAATMKALSTRLRPQRVYGGEHAAYAPGADADETYELRAMVCYYGSHYASFARTDDARSRAGAGPWDATIWTRFDDAAVTRVGAWAAVCDACARGHLQPTVLFYERPTTVLF
jgi:hypothetical protein